MCPKILLCNNAMNLVPKGWVEASSLWETSWEPHWFPYLYFLLDNPTLLQCLLLIL
jgi:hypothetical protein